jgi:hypothetical protein
MVLLPVEILSLGKIAFDGFSMRQTKVGEKDNQFFSEDLILLPCQKRNLVLKKPSKRTNQLDVLTRTPAPDFSL